MAHRKPSSPHPLILAAAISLMLFAVVGSAALLGWLPATRGETQPVSLARTSTPVPDTQLALAAPAAPKFETPAQLKPVAPKAVARPAAPQVIRTVYRESALAPRKTICHDCGVIESVREVTQAGEGSGLGAVIGGVTGAVVGRQFGGGKGKDLMTVVGVVGGGVAGHQIEKRVRATKHYEVTVRFDDGSSEVFQQETADWRSGERVKVADGRLLREF